MNLARTKRLAPAVFVFIITFSVYLYTLCPTVYWDDAGELIAACYTLGIPHPPGHPLYAIIGWLFTHTPVGSPAYRVNLMSAFFGALTCAVLFQIVRELIEAKGERRRAKGETFETKDERRKTKGELAEGKRAAAPGERRQAAGGPIDQIEDPIPPERDKIQNRTGIAAFAGIIAALSAAFSLILWDQSVVAETTTLHTFFMMVVTLIAFRIHASGAIQSPIPRRRDKIQNIDEPQTHALLPPDRERLTPQLLILSFIYGLSFTNHVAGLFFAPSLAIVLLAALRLKLFKPVRLLAMILLFALGLSVYAYLPLRSRFNPPIDWGNPETLQNFLWVVTARQYSLNILRIPTLIGFKAGLHSMATTLLSNLSILGCGFALVGAVRLWKARKSVLIYGVTIIAILFFISLNSAFISAYLAPAILILAMWAGAGVAYLCELVKPPPRAVPSSPRSFSPFSPFRLFPLSYVAAVLLVAILLTTHFRENNKRHYTHAKNYGMSLLSSLPSNAVLITGTADPLFISWYLQYCENYRTDVQIITRNGLIRPGYLAQIHRQYPGLNIPEEFRYENAANPRPASLNEREEGLPWYANSYFKLFYERNCAKFPIFWEGIEANQMMIERFVPFDFVFQIIPSGGQLAPAPKFLKSAEIRREISSDLAAGKVYGNHMFNYGVYCQLRNDMSAALIHFQDALYLWPDDARALNNIGALLAAQGREREAIQKFIMAYRANPGDPTSNHNVGQVLLNRGEVRKAAPHFKAAIALDPGNFEDYYDLGLCYATLGKNASAVDMFKKALEMKPESPEAISSLGVTYLRLGETENAAKLLKMAVELEPGNAENWYNLACLQALKGDQTGSADSLSKALTLDYKKTYTLASKNPRIFTILQRLLTQR